jgi:hypothetical protein
MPDLNGSASLLTLLFKAIELGRHARISEARLVGIVDSGWCHRWQIDDLMYDLGLPGCGDDLLAQIKVSPQTIFHRPRRIATSVGGGEGIRAAELATLLIRLECLGMAIDPAPLVTLLAPAVAKLQVVTNCELNILWFAGTRHNTAPIVLRAAATDLNFTRSKTVITASKYKATAYLAGDEVQMLTVCAPRYRRRPAPVKTVCEICGYEWFKGDSSSSLAHRREHKKRLVILEPQPHPQFLKALAHEKEPELVTTISPRWRHRQIYDRAVVFRREFHYDFVQWQSPKGDDDLKVHGFLLNDDTATFGHEAIVGACAFRWREYKNAAARWAMQWVWIAPKARRLGILSRRWPEFRARFGDFVLEPPLSEAMQAFADKHGHRQ